jgi:hypothetical protein
LESWEDIFSLLEEIPEGLLSGGTAAATTAAAGLSAEAVAALTTFVGLLAGVLGGVGGWYAHGGCPCYGTEYIMSTNILDGKVLKKRLVIRDSKELATVNTATYKAIEVLGAGEADPSLNVVSLEYSEIDLAESDLDANGAWGAAVLHYGSQTSTSCSVAESTYIPGTHAKISRHADGGFAGVAPARKSWPPGVINLPIESNGAVYMTLTVDQDGASSAKQMAFVCAIVSLWG